MLKFLVAGLVLFATPAAAEINLRISLSEQQIYVYDDDTLIDSADISSGKTGYETPVGSYRITRKEPYHWSKKFKAPMPYAQFFTGGIALHTGQLPGYAASHGCVRLPNAFAKHLYEITKIGTPVVVEE